MRENGGYLPVECRALGQGEQMAVGGVDRALLAIRRWWLYTQGVGGGGYLGKQHAQICFPKGQSRNPIKDKGL